MIKRGRRIYCYTSTYYPILEYYWQKEYGESLAHTFYIIGLSPGKPYWVAFTAQANLEETRSVSSYFTIIHPHGASPLTDNIRPIGAGTYCNIPGQVGDPCPNHWKNVDESVPDENTTHIINNAGHTCSLIDTYKFAPVSLIAAPVDYLQVTARLATAYGYGYAARARMIVRTHGINYYSTSFSDFPTYYVNRTYMWGLNPFTHLKWTPQELNDMEIGIELNYYSGVPWATATKCTQLYATIGHSCLPLE